MYHLARKREQARRSFLSGNGFHLYHHRLKRFGEHLGWVSKA